MQGILVQVARIRGLHDPAEVHDGDPRAEVFDHGEVVGDEQVREAELLLQVLAGG